MLIGEYTIILQDVNILLGLVIDDEYVTRVDCDNWTQLCHDLLGVTPHDN